MGIKDKIRNNKLFSYIFNLIPTNKTIVFESCPNLSDNTKAVFDEMIRRGINSKYKLVWILYNNDNHKYPEIHNVKYIKSDNFKNFYYKITAKCLISCNNIIASFSKKQFSMYLTHGSPIKNLHNWFDDIAQKIDFCLCASEDMVPIYEYSYSFPKEKIVPLGFPRNDVLISKSKDLNIIFSDVDFDKCLVWYPTYRQNKRGVSLSKNAFPIIHDCDNAEELNEIAKKNRCLIVVKPHFAQDVSYIKNMNLSNIRFINDEFFITNNITSYEFVGSCDAMITDYSSIYYDYTLSNKPVALIWEDIEEYKKSQGFCPGIEEFLDGGEKVYNIDDLKNFIINVACENDLLKKERNIVKNKVNYSDDGKSASRVVDFIVEKAKIRI